MITKSDAEENRKVPSHLNGLHTVVREKLGLPSVAGIPPCVLRLPVALLCFAF